MPFTSGPWRIPSHMAVAHVSMPLAKAQFVIKRGVVPFEWKEANIMPLFKKGSRNKLDNYRSVSLTSVICKLLERLIKDHYGGLPC